MRIALVLSLVLAVLAVVFALQNPAEIRVFLGAWEIRGSTALILLVTFGLGVLVGLLSTLPGFIRRGRRLRQIERHPIDSSTSESAFDYAPPKSDASL